MAQEQSQRSGEPALGECAVCGKVVTPDDPGTLRFVAVTGTMSHVHTRCEKPAE